MKSNPEKSGPENSDPGFRADRRRLLWGGASAAVGTVLWSNTSGAAVRLCASLAPIPGGEDSRTLVLIQLSGGNDGLSTIVPYGDDAYYRARSTIAVERASVLEIDDYRGFHPELKQLARLYSAGRLAIVEGAGYPHPSRSHFKSLEIWHTANERGRSSGEGWVGRLCEAAWSKDHCPELTVHIGGAPPYALFSTKHPAVAMQTAASYRWVAPKEEDEAAYRASPGKATGKKSEESGQSAVLSRLRGVLADAQESSLRIRRAARDYRPGVDYPDGDFAEALLTAAALIDARIGSRVVSLELSGFDTHNAQRPAHDALMRRLDAALGAFVDDLARTRAGQSTVVLVFSEFGRRLEENGSRGTDHGLAAPMFVAGAGVRGGLYGKHPSLAKLDDGDLVHTTDFRSVYATIIERWFGADHARVLDARYPLLDFVSA